MHTKLTSFIAFFLLALVTGCNSSGPKITATSFVNPDEISFKPKRIIVIGPPVAIEYKAKFENAAVEFINNRNAKGYSQISLFPPVKEYSEEEIEKVINELEIDSYLQIHMTGYEGDSSYAGTYFMNMGYGNSMGIPISQYSFAAGVSARLTKIWSDTTIYNGNVNVSGSGNRYTDIDYQIRLLSHSIITDMEKKELLESRQNN